LDKNTTQNKIQNTKKRKITRYKIDSRGFILESLLTSYIPPNYITNPWPHYNLKKDLLILRITNQISGVLEVYKQAYGSVKF